MCCRRCRQIGLFILVFSESQEPVCAKVCIRLNPKELAKDNLKSVTSDEEL